MKLMRFVGVQRCQHALRVTTQLHNVIDINDYIDIIVTQQTLLLSPEIATTIVLHIVNYPDYNYTR